MRTKEHQVEFCVVGGGLAGMCAAIAAARHGVKTLLMQDRPVLGGNASSEIRMWICGAHGENTRETGLVEEIRLENLYRNTTPNYSIWDTILYEKVKFQENLTVLLNCSCNDAEMDGNKIKSIKGWQLTSETWHVVKAGLFADCSGDSILAPLTGAEFRYGREARAEFDESIAPEQTDDMTMGMSCLIQAREMDSPQPFTPPSWVNHYPTDDSLPNRGHEFTHTQNFWWLEIGGTKDTVHDCEEIRDELLKIALGVWDHIKNHGDHGADNWTLDWLGFLPGKRESRRYVGDHILTQNDVRDEGKFDDIVAYGGWPMDDHHPDGFEYPGKPTIFHHAPSPFGIPYRALYSKNIDNLFFAGRNISATHAAMSSTRVMATCGTMGQAIGTAAAVAVRNSLSPRGVFESGMAETQELLMNDDCWLPGKKRHIASVCVDAALTTSNGKPDALRNGHDRTIDETSNGWSCEVGDWCQYTLEKEDVIHEIRFVFDSNLNRDARNMVSNYPKDLWTFTPPATLVKAFKVELQDKNGDWKTIHQESNNYQRLVKIPVNEMASAIKMTIEGTHGEEKVEVFSFDFS